MSNVFLPIGGGNEIGASSYFVKLGSTKFLLDSGMRLHGKYKHPRFVSLYEHRLIDHLRDLDAILISHGHLDHIGSLPTVTAEAKNVPIYTTKPTLDILELQLKPTRIDEAYIDVKAVLKYKEQLVQQTIDIVKIVEWNRSIRLKDCQLSFFRAGHILGASMIYIESNSGNILFTGDFTPFDQETVPSYQIPDDLTVDLLITESTYGYQEAVHADNIEEEREVFASKIKKYLARDGWVLIPAFAIGRSQEVALILQGLIYSNKLKSFPIYIDGLAQIVSNIYANNGVKVFSENIKKAGKKLIRHLDTADRGVIISSSGMLLDRSASARYAEKLLPGSQNALFFSGYLDEESPGRRLDQMRNSTRKPFLLNGKDVQVSATVDTYRLSAHTDNKGILKLIEKLSPKNVIFVHGKPQQKSGINIYLDTWRQFQGRTTVYQANNGIPIYF